jgi:hypothetical protein
MADANDQYVEFLAGYTHGEFDTTQTTTLYRLQASYSQVYDSVDFSVTAPYLFLNDSIGKDSGIGDLILRAGMTIGTNHHSNNNLYASIAIKLPTADESKGLGTGETDTGAFISYMHRLNTLNLTLMGGYIVTGDSTAQSYEDILVYGVGLSKYIGQRYIYISVDGRQQILNTGGNPLELSGGFLYQIKPTQYLKTEGFLGLNDNSPDYGLSIGLVNWF